jgi:RNA polymerase subunit RPABC4/transcription elongation factor Spt4
MPLNPFPPGDEPTCPECGSPLVTEAGVGGRRTLVAGESGYSENGVYHNHDPNWNINTYKCKKGHTIRRKTRRSCPAKECDFGGEEKLIVTDSKK